ncbi:tRNA adenosine deaminase-associated protein [Streptomonospora nanhaiensis]|uniref:Putative tRNA adenosine deaminase-associated protein n=1 Tax=Streptomonospora nanhaiensis TaxID=1323731 RepID=A0A853BPX9_9ACTN|nr:tRNA adenosine deaminase-associated protein [Streptomonospora nanhaiensis]MBV2364050.1 tRNA adenosine deaminase-associated protein [Streptomonospora nanhaiensis]MBX9388666.1 tRNA adenosine deaminase-associated protein [Streptomonospora nanhaiensis]NYI97050.1 putative tRNA adenosine deaminase-associated protein [Streptomonospora nanhaiensis]
MAIFSAVFCRGQDDEWRGVGVEGDLAEAATIDDIADTMRDVSGAAAEGTMVLLVEADDEWFAVVRVDDHTDPRVFLSDVRVVHEHPVAALLQQSGGIEAPEQTEGTGQKPYPVPGGDTELLADIGVPAGDLVSLTTSEGLLPGDVLAEIAERAGFAEPLDALRL